MKHVETVQEIEKKLSMEIEFENQMNRKKKDVNSLSRRHFVRLVKNNVLDQLSLTEIEQQSDVRHSEMLQHESTIDVSISMPLVVDNIMQHSDQNRFQEIATNNSDDFHNSFNTNDQTKNGSLDLKLQKWVVDFHVTHNCVNAFVAVVIATTAASLSTSAKARPRTG
ncbi:hypothetical protein ACI65C_003962 [Semiaphis heraclei]